MHHSPASFQRATQAANHCAIIHSGPRTYFPVSTAVTEAAFCRSLPSPGPFQYCGAKPLAGRWPTPKQSNDILIHTYDELQIPIHNSFILYIHTMHSEHALMVIQSRHNKYYGHNIDSSRQLMAFFPGLLLNMTKYISKSQFAARLHTLRFNTNLYNTTNSIFQRKHVYT